MKKTVAYEKVQKARSNKRPTSAHYIENVFDGFFELHGDRAYADDAAIIAGVARLNEVPVTVIGIEKGQDARERVKRNFGAPNPEGYRKALRLMKQAEKFGRPIVTFVDTSGAFCGIGAEERGQGQAIAHNLLEMSTLKVPFIALVIGEGGSGGALALAVGDKIWMLENAIYSVISPEGCASILLKDAKRASEVADNLKLTAEDALGFGLIDRIIEEDNMGKPDFYQKISDLLSIELAALSALPPEELVANRAEKIRALGNIEKQTQLNNSHELIENSHQKATS